MFLLVDAMAPHGAPGILDSWDSTNVTSDDGLVAGES